MIPSSSVELVTINEEKLKSSPEFVTVAALFKIKTVGFWMDSSAVK